MEKIDNIFPQRKLVLPISLIAFLVFAFTLHQSSLLIHYAHQYFESPYSASFNQSSEQQSYMRPYWTPGSLLLTAEHAQWRPFSKKCPVPKDYVSMIRLKDEGVSLFKDRTIVTLGDSVNRFAVRE